jgi:hypothetical protein
VITAIYLMLSEEGGVNGRIDRNRKKAFDQNPHLGGIEADREIPPWFVFL